MEALFSVSLFYQKLPCLSIIYCGNSVFIDPYGKIISKCKENEEDTAIAEADIVLLEAFRKKFPVLEDSDND